MKTSSTPSLPALRSTRLLEQVREMIRYRHYSLSTEKNYVYWVRFFVRWSGRQGQMRHPRNMGQAEVKAFLAMLANERQVSASTHNQALSALLFLYREVLGQELPWLIDLPRPSRSPRIPSFLSREETQALLHAVNDPLLSLIIRLIYGTGMRLHEALRLRIKDVDTGRRVLIVREAKGGKGRGVQCHVYNRALSLFSLTSPAHARSTPAEHRRQRRTQGIYRAADAGRARGAGA